MPRFRWLFLASLSVILLLQLRGFDAPLRSPETPGGIVGLELAFTPERAQAIVDRWQQMGVIETARVGLGVDFGFLLIYPAFFWYSAHLLTARSRLASWRGRRLGQWLGPAVLACTPLDALENLMLWRVVSDAVTPERVLIASVAATLKFLLVGSTALWCLVAWVQSRRAPVTIA